MPDPYETKRHTPITPTERAMEIQRLVIILCRFRTREELCRCNGEGGQCVTCRLRELVFQEIEER